MKGIHNARKEVGGRSLNKWLRTSNVHLRFPWCFDFTIAPRPKTAAAHMRLPSLEGPGCGSRRRRRVLAAPDQGPWDLRGGKVVISLENEGIPTCEK
jgi:hypothetical protein